MAVRSEGLLERSGELARLRESITSAREGVGAAVVIEGPAGIGKTSLLAAASHRAADAGLLVLTARAGQLERGLGWNLVRQLFAGVIAADAKRRRGILEGAAALAAPALGLSAGADPGAL